LTLDNKLLLENVTSFQASVEADGTLAVQFTIEIFGSRIFSFSVYPR